MPVRLRKQNKGVLLPRELSPAYERIAANPRVSGILEELKRVNSGNSTRGFGEQLMENPHSAVNLNEKELSRAVEYANAEEKEEGAFDNRRLLQKLGRAVYSELQSEVNAASKGGDQGFERFKKEFGHAPANVRQGKPDAIGCASHAIAIALLAERAGLKTGILDLPRHTLPVVKLEGKNYVLERKLYGKPNALTITGYLRELAKAHSQPNHPLHGIARASFSEGKPDAGDFASKTRYYGGAESGEAVIHLNLGEHYAENGEASKARKHFEASISAFDTPLARSRLASVLEKQGSPALALKQALAAHSLQPNDENHLLQARGIAGRMGWNNRAKELNDEAYALLARKRARAVSEETAKAKTETESAKAAGERKRALALSRERPFSEEAARALKEYLKKQPRDALAHSRLSRVLMRLDYVNNRGDHSEAREHFNAALRLREQKQRKE